MKLSQRLEDTGIFFATLRLCVKKASKVFTELCPLSLKSFPITTDRNKVILVDEADKETGTTDKLTAHREGLLHRAFSIFIFNSKGELLLQKRAEGKYHSGGLWSNTCCSHPQPGEDLLHSAEKRLTEETGLKTQLKRQFHFIYKAVFDNGLTEYELDHVFTGTTDDMPVIIPDEAEAYRYVGLSALKKSVSENPQQFTVWFRMIYNKAFDFYTDL